MSEPSAVAARSANVAKALLLCAHAGELSVQSILAIRSGATEHLFALQTRKQTIIDALAGLLQPLDVEEFPDLQQAVGRLQETLHIESRMLSNASAHYLAELASVSAAQRRLTQARCYGTATQPDSPDEGGRLSISG